MNIDNIREADLSPLKKDELFAIAVELQTALKTVEALNDDDNRLDAICRKIDALKGFIDHSFSAIDLNAVGNRDMILKRLSPRSADKAIDFDKIMAAPTPAFQTPKLKPAKNPCKTCGGLISWDNYVKDGPGQKYPDHIDDQGNIIASCYKGGS